MNKTEKLGCILVVLGIVVQPVLTGAAFAQMWAWFVVPTFHVAVMSLPAAVGIAETAWMVTYHFQFVPRASSDAERQNAIWQGVGAAYVFPLFVLFVGWVAQHWM